MTDDKTRETEKKTGAREDSMARRQWVSAEKILSAYGDKPFILSIECAPGNWATKIGTKDYRGAMMSCYLGLTVAVIERLAMQGMSDAAIMNKLEETAYAAFSCLDGPYERRSQEARSNFNILRNQDERKREKEK